MRNGTDSFALNPITLGAVIAGVIAFVLTGGLGVMLWVAIAGALGAGLGWVVHLALQTRGYASGAEFGERSPSTRTRS